MTRDQLSSQIFDDEDSHTAKLELHTSFRFLRKKVKKTPVTFRIMG
jgi:hypothetical protein